MRINFDDLSKERQEYILSQVKSLEEFNRDAPICQTCLTNESVVRCSFGAWNCYDCGQQVLIKAVQK